MGVLGKVMPAYFTYKITDKLLVSLHVGLILVGGH